MPTMPALTGRKYALFAVIAVFLSLAFTVGCLAAAELSLHWRYGMNLWGYRGPSLGRKPAGEARIAVLGGSTAWGYGVAWNEAFPYYLAQELTARRSQQGRGPVSIANLAFNNEGAHSFRYTLQDYEYLNYDVVLLYTGYNDLGGPNLSVFRHASALFPSTGVLLLLPSIFREWAMALRQGRLGDKTVFKPHPAKRAAAAALETAGLVVTSLERQLGTLSRNVDDPQIPPERDCPDRWQHYCTKLLAAVTYALDRDKNLLVVTQPYLADSHVEQQRAVAAMLRSRFPADPRIVHVNLGRTVDVRDPILAFDGMHLTAAGNRRIADSLIEPALRMIGEK
jgi:lysophospholipase L1-like esterase